MAELFLEQFPAAERQRLHLRQRQEDGERGVDLGEQEVGDGPVETPVDVGIAVRADLCQPVGDQGGDAGDRVQRLPVALIGLERASGHVGRGSGGQGLGCPDLRFQRGQEVLCLTACLLC